MNTLNADRDEVTDPKVKLWVSRARRDACIAPDENALWLVDVEQTWLDPRRDETWTESFYRSPGDALAWAESRACNAARRDGIGRWTLEVFGDGVNAPTVLRVHPTPDPEGADL